MNHLLPDSVFSAYLLSSWDAQVSSLWPLLFCPLFILEKSWGHSRKCQLAWNKTLERELILPGLGEFACLFQLCLNQDGWIYKSQEDVSPSCLLVWNCSFLLLQQGFGRLGGSGPVLRGIPAPPWIDHMLLKERKFCVELQSQGWQMARMHVQQEVRSEQNCTLLQTFS